MPDYSLRQWAILIGMGLLVFLLLIAVWISWRFPIGRTLNPHDEPSFVYVTADGKPFAQRGFVKDPPVDASRLPKEVTVPFLAVEDRRFWKHFGIDPKATARALAANSEAGAVVEGGSTITQQLAKTAFLDDERTLRRKIQEALIAVWLELRLSKQEIFSRYLSSVYFGDGVYGLRGAARHYYGKKPEDLTVQESAMLAGLLKAPSRYAPTRNPKAANERYRVVLQAMLDAGVIRPSDAAAYAKNPPKVRKGERQRDLPSGHWMADWLAPQVDEQMTRNYGVTTIRTTLDSKLQAAAERSVSRVLATQGRSAGATQAALVAMKADGRIVAMVGGREYGKSVFNRATQAKRQPGSAFKPFVWAAALRGGMSPTDIVMDVPVRIGNWAPRNFEDRYAGRITLTDALVKSSNSVSAQLTNSVGPGQVADTAALYGIRSELEPTPSLALGSEEVTLIELTSAYASAFRGQGPVRPWGLLDHPPEQELQDLPESRALVTMLGAVVARGTGRRAYVEPITFGKTGTSQNHKDAWFVGYARGLIVGVWVGNDNGAPMREVTGGSMPAEIFRQFASAAPRGRGPTIDMQAAFRSLTQPDPAPSYGTAPPIGDLPPGWPDGYPTESLPMGPPPRTDEELEIEQYLEPADPQDRGEPVRAPREDYRDDYEDEDAGPPPPDIDPRPPRLPDEDLPPPDIDVGGAPQP